MAGQSEVLDVGRATRTVSAAQWKALVARDRHCTAPGCTRPPSHCDAHHIQHWDQGGPTDIANLRLLCWHHHRQEHLEHAQARGARIYAEVAGYGSTCEAFHRVRLAECGEEPARAIGLAMNDAGVPPEAVHYVNLHGTSTELNDRIETRALKLALNSRAHLTPMSALKSQIGHPQGACGAAGIAATLIAMRHGQIPPTINLDQPDPECDLDYVPDMGRRADIEHAICNCIAFGSKNSALVLRRLA
jgi:3-oxoacyl-(acyl-carrier-protein) synthase